MAADETPRAGTPRAVLVSLQLPGVTDAAHEADVAELGRLVKTLGLEVVGTVSQRRAHPRAGTVLGLGKLEELAAFTGGTGKIPAHVPQKTKAQLRREKAEESAAAAELAGEPEADAEAEPDVEPDDAGASPGARPAPAEPAEIVVVNHELTPREQRNLEKATGAEVLDRSQVIVEIFHRHAKSREARLQVEIARLTYVAPRLREAGAGADRQRGGIGGKGAGESAVELDRRRIRDRIAELKRELEKIAAEQGVRRAQRRAQRRVALVGYTNAGKSSFMRALTGSTVYVADKLFATLDTTVRALKPETEPRILVSDTVGFIKNLPHELVASFRSTLDEALEASLLLHLVDAADPTFREQLAVTRAVLADIGASAVPSCLVLNKRDKLSAAAQAELALEFPDALLVSVREPADVERVRAHIVTFFDGAREQAELFVPYERHALVRRVHEGAEVLAERHDERGTHLEVRGPATALARLRELLAAGG
ncbi:MAG: GTPase HflX [Polyangiaceae bacterium]|nr:GTPase HflX [Polyangiaceae bacterium]